MRKRDRLALYCFIAFSFFLLEESWRLGLGNLHHPGPGFLAFGCAAIIAIVAISQLAIGRGKKVEGREPFFKKERLPKFLLVVLGCFGYGLLLYYIGFVLCTGLFVLICLKTIEPRKWGQALLISIAAAVVSWLLFDYWLRIPTPEGAWVYPIYKKIELYLWK